MTISLLLIGFFIGMRHALESDHVAAIASLATGSSSVKQTAWQGAVWGLGHTLTLFIFGSIVLLADSVIPEQFAAFLEFIVGLMLIGLGTDVLWRLYKKRIHFHIHKHNSIQHFHAHSHSGEDNHKKSKHEHEHCFPKRALYIGLMHGMAGSASLIVLTLQTVQATAIGMLYILLFGVGSIIGMATLSVVIAIPLRYSSNELTWLYNSLQAIVGVSTILLGGVTTFHYLV